MRNGRDIAVSAAQQVHDVLSDIVAANDRIGRGQDNITFRYGALSVIVDDITIRRLTALYVLLCDQLNELDESELPTDNNALSAEK